MNARRLARGFALVAIVGVAPVNAAHAQEHPAIDHATRVLDLLEAGKFEEVVAEFNAKMAAAMPVSRLRDVWTTVSRQAGARTSIISQRVVMQTTGNITVVTGGQFEKAALNVMLSFDPENKIAGMNITPRAPLRQRLRLAAAGTGEDHAVAGRVVRCPLAGIAPQGLGRLQIQRGLRHDPSRSVWRRGCR